MKHVLLTKDNIDSLKYKCETLFPVVRSSHLSEAIARGLGFGSNAALRVSLETSRKPKIKVAAFNGVEFHSWLTTRGYEIVFTNFNLLLESLDAPIWVASKSKATRDNWFYSARRYNIPMVHIAPRTKYADVHWDYISVDESHKPDKFTRDELNRIGALVAQYNGNYRFFGVSVFTGTIYQLKIDEAKMFASEIFMLLHNLISEKCWRSKDPKG